MSPARSDPSPEGREDCCIKTFLSGQAEYDTADDATQGTAEALGSQCKGDINPGINLFYG
jgi:hypothetical protein